MVVVRLTKDPFVTLIFVKDPLVALTVVVE